ncbi:MAG: GNAT family N-acetyltransferase, partial [Bacilli bacterium]
MIIRKAIPNDISAITAIYNHAILHTTATFDTEPKRESDMEVWFKKFENPLHVLLVAVIEDVVVGYACIQYFKEKDAYNNTVENSIYVSPSYRSRGIATRLLQSLIEHAKQLNHANIIAVIAENNDTSVSLHTSAGFIYAGSLQSVGFKFNEWLT